MSVTITFEIQVLREHIEAAPRVIGETIAATREFDGCLGVDVLHDSEDATHFTLLELWETFEHHAAYNAWRGTPEGASGIRDIIAAAPITTRYEHLDV